jgi:hypothetical protein
MQLAIRGDMALKGLHIRLPGQGAELGVKAIRLEALDLAPLQNRYSAQRLLLPALRCPAWPWPRRAPQARHRWLQPLPRTCLPCSWVSWPARPAVSR